MRKLAGQLQDELREQGRSAEGFGCEAVIGYGAGPAAWREALEAWEPVGLTHLSMRAMSTGTKLMGEPDPGFTSPAEHIAALERFMVEMK